MRGDLEKGSDLRLFGIKTETSYGVDKPMTNPQKFWPCSCGEIILKHNSFMFKCGCCDVPKEWKLCPNCLSERPPAEEKDWLQDIIRKGFHCHQEVPYRDFPLELTNAIRAHIREHRANCFHTPSCVCCNWWIDFLGISERKDGGM